MNKKAIAAYREFIEALGLDLDKELRQTPERVSELYEVLFAGIGKKTKDVWGEIFPTDFSGLAQVESINFYSMCEHHFLPFFGTVDIVYEPQNGRVAGLSKLDALITLLSRRPQLQERLTEQIATAIMQDLGAAGVLVRISAKHLCMAMKGDSSPDTIASTLEGSGTMKAGGISEAKGLFLLGESNDSSKKEL